MCVSDLLVQDTHGFCHVLFGFDPGLEKFCSLLVLLLCVTRVGLAGPGLTVFAESATDPGRASDTRLQLPVSRPTCFRMVL